MNQIEIHCVWLRALNRMVLQIGEREREREPGGSWKRGKWRRFNGGRGRIQSDEGAREEDEEEREGGREELTTEPPSEW